jgi:hypothetical protein
MQNLLKNAAQLMFKKEVLVRAKGNVKIGKGKNLIRPFPSRMKEDNKLICLNNPIE